MFQSIKYIDNIADYKTKMYHLFYMLEDTEFTVKLDIPIEMQIYGGRGDASVIPSGLLWFYKSNNKEVAKNLALFYLSMRCPLNVRYNFIEADRAWTNTHFPNAQYNKYYNCIRNQVQIMNFGGKYK